MRSASAFFRPSRRPFGSNAVFGSAPARSWSRMASGILSSLRRGMLGLLRSHHARSHTKFPTGPGVVAAFPYRIHTVLTDNGVAFTRCAASKWDRMVHPFDRVGEEHGIKHKLTKPYHPWTNGQAERMNRTVKEATVKTFHYQTLESLKAHLQTFLAAYNFAKHLKALRWRTPFQAVCDAWQSDPSAFKIDPHYLIPGPHT